MFDKKNKSTIDTLVPIAGTALIYYYFIAKMKADIKDKLIYLAVIWLILYLATSRITKNILKENLDIDDQSWNVNNQSSGVIAIGGNQSSTAAVNLANKLQQDISGLRTRTDDALYESLALLSAQQLGQVAQQYQADTGESLYQALKGESFIPFVTCNWGTQDKVKTIMNRLQQMGLL